jgi:predicted phage terminase large subunit-like protein
MATSKKKELEPLMPQKGPQTKFLKSNADIAIYGGAAGAGKTFAVLFEPTYHLSNPDFGAVIFRRNSNQVRNEGGLWDTSMKIYTHYQLRGIPKESTLEWDFPNGSRIKFAHLQYDSDVLSWQGAQIPLIIFDELTHFTRSQFFYLLSRNRSACGVRPYVRATTNPDADSWVRDLVDWWIDPRTGLAIPERSGVKRWFINLNDKLIWADTKAEIVERYEGALPKSFTFVSASIFDNQKLLKADPGYLASLQALPTVDRERLLNGNWNIKPSAGLYFQRRYFEFVRTAPKKTKAVRYWDRAATRKNDTNDPDYTVGILLEKDEDGIFYVADMVRLQESPLGVQQAIKNTAAYDGKGVVVGIEQDPGQAGVFEAQHIARLLQGYNVKLIKPGTDKVTRASPVSAQAEAGNIKIVIGNWNEDFIKELESFPEAPHDDIVDALSGAFNMLTEKKYNFAAINS